MRIGLRLSDTNRVLLGLYGPTIIMSLGQGMVVPTIPALTSTFDVSAGLAAQIVTARMLGAVVALLPVGVLLDRFGRKPVLVGGLAKGLGLCFGRTRGPGGTTSSPKHDPVDTGDKRLAHSRYADRARMSCARPRLEDPLVLGR